MTRSAGPRRGGEGRGGDVSSVDAAVGLLGDGVEAERGAGAGAAGAPRPASPAAREEAAILAAAMALAIRLLPPFFPFPVELHSTVNTG